MKPNPNPFGIKYYIFSIPYMTKLSDNLSLTPEKKIL